MGAETEDEDLDQEVSQETEVENEEQDEESSQQVSANGQDHDDDEEDDELDTESDDGESRLGHSEGEHDQETIREQRRQQRKEKKRRAKEYRERLNRELNFLRQRNESLERQFSGLSQRQTQNEALTLEQKLNQTKAQLKVANDVIAAAINENRGADVVEATNIKDQLSAQLNRLEQVKAHLAERIENDEVPAPNRRAAPPPRLVSLASQWMQKNTWYDPRNLDEDSALVTHLDQQIMRSGSYDPQTPEYYEELTRRVKKFLPHKFTNGGSADGAASAKAKKGGGPAFSAGGRERPLASNQVFIDAERKRALQDAGVWDDPVLRKKYVAAYSKYDRENSRNP